LEGTCSAFIAFYPFTYVANYSVPATVGFVSNSQDFIIQEVPGNLLLKPYGNVGIGTDNPQATLSVNGNIRATEVEVLALVDTPPDYVFAPDYKLSTLQEVETYVKKNSHLPDVPSAKDFEENGQNLGKMNFILLKKVEELTLHLIDQNKQIELIKTENKKLQEQITKLSK